MKQAGKSKTSDPDRLSFEKSLEVLNHFGFRPAVKAPVPHKVTHMATMVMDLDIQGTHPGAKGFERVMIDKRVVPGGQHPAGNSDFG